MRKLSSQLTLMIAAVVGFTGGCTRDQVMRITYETLRQEDCHRTAAHTGYCDRSYAFEYAEYKQLREAYLRDIGYAPDESLTLSLTEEDLLSQ